MQYIKCFRFSESSVYILPNSSVTQKEICRDGGEDKSLRLYKISSHVLNCGTLTLSILHHIVWNCWDDKRNHGCSLPTLQMKSQSFPQSHPSHPSPTLTHNVGPGKKFPWPRIWHRDSHLSLLGIFSLVLNLNPDTQ